MVLETITKLNKDELLTILNNVDLQIGFINEQCKSYSNCSPDTATEEEKKKLLMMIMKMHSLTFIKMDIRRVLMYKFGVVVT